jgi:hypothetical protein
MKSSITGGLSFLFYPRLGDVPRIHFVASFYKSGDGLRRPNGGRKGDPLEITGESHESIHGRHQVRSSLRSEDGMDLIKDDGGQVLQDGPASRRAEQKVEAFRRGDQNFRRMTDPPAAVRRWRVPASGQDLNGRKRFSGPAKNPFQFAKRPEEVALNVVVERPQRRYIQDAGLPGRPLSNDKLVQGPQEGRQRLSASGWSRYQEMFAAGDLRPGLFLKIRGPAHSVREPASDQGMKLRQIIFNFHKDILEFPGMPVKKDRSPPPPNKFFPANIRPKTKRLRVRS